MGRLYLVRHGQANLLGEDYDQLSGLGERQAAVTGRALAAQGVHPVAVLSGGLRRQSETARIMRGAAGWSANALIDPDFDEYRHSDLFTPRFPEFAEHAALAAHVARMPDPRKAFQDVFETAFRAWLDGAVGSGLTWADFRARIVAAATRAASLCGSGDTVVIVSSGGAIAAICQHLLGVPDSEVLRLHNPVHNASITRIMTSSRDMALSGFNDISHFTSTGEPGLVTYR